MVSVLRGSGHAGASFSGKSERDEDARPIRGGAAVGPTPRSISTLSLHEFPRTSHTTVPRAGATSWSAELGGFVRQPAVSAVLIGMSLVAGSTMTFHEGHIGMGTPAAAAEAEDLARDVLNHEVTPKAAQAESPEAKELRTKVSALVDKEFGGDYRKAFNRFAGQDQHLNRSEVISLLKRAGIGNMLTRGAWADGILERFDANKSGTISWTEFSAVCPVG